MEEIQQAHGVESRVCDDIACRQALGLKKYGVQVADAGLSLREWLQHAYEEHLDAAIYLRAAIERIDNKSSNPLSDVLNNPIGFTNASEIEYVEVNRSGIGDFYAVKEDEEDIPIYSKNQLVDAILIANTAKGL